MMHVLPDTLSEMMLKVKIGLETLGGGGDKKPKPKPKRCCDAYVKQTRIVVTVDRGRNASDSVDGALTGCVLHEFL